MGRLLQVTAALIGLMAAATATLAQNPADKPRVPPGVDPGGVAIAIIGSGIDYTRPEIAAHLARDGEGEIIGWDFVDNDRRPYASCRTIRPEALCLPYPLENYAAAKPSHRIVVFRASTTVPQSLVQAAQAAGQTRARIVVLALSEPLPIQFLRDAAQRYPANYFVAVVDLATAEMPGTVLSDNTVAIPAGPGSIRLGGALAWLIAREAEGLVTKNPRIDNDAIRCRLAEAPGSLRLPGSDQHTPMVTGCPPPRSEP